MDGRCNNSFVVRLKISAHHAAVVQVGAGDVVHGALVLGAGLTGHMGEAGCFPGRLATPLYCVLAVLGRNAPGGWPVFLPQTDAPISCTLA